MKPFPDFLKKNYLLFSLRFRTFLFPFNSFSLLQTAAVEKTEGKKLMTEEGFDSKKGGRSAVMRAKDYKNIFKKMPFVGTRYPDQSAMADI
ncbi:unnamed protein product [Microthlaspi erraticum]|uniref:Uncharacterized protein n=1 Tax=Microthlaspi erraticum TaxID=1685480 RepID=A0A6D2HTY3_9BRAS|nr:unnamed protein product [Microthlaspi erraticum]